MLFRSYYPRPEVKLGQTELKGVKAWDNKEPYLYTLGITLYNEKGEVTEFIPYQVGFRKVELKNKVICLNGKRLVINGVALKEAMERIAQLLRTSLQQISSSAEQVAGGAEQMSNSAQLLSQGASEQAGSIEELAASINEISDSVKENADNAVKSSQLTDISLILRSEEHTSELQ